LSLLVVISAGGGFWYYVQEFLPSINKVSDAPVKGLPKQYAEIQADYTRAYQGPLPRFTGRPEETFNFPIQLGEFGPVEPLFAQVNAYPFWCGKDHSRMAFGREDVDQENGYLLQPSVDNQAQIGVPVFAVDENGQRTSTVLGYSRDCQFPTAASYYYLSNLDDRFHPLHDEVDPQAIAKIEVEGRWIDFVVRLETGTINRYFYAIAVLRGDDETLENPIGQYWNRRLVYQFRGGVGIGKRQGNFKPKDVLRRRQKQLSQGYAVVYSTANQTSNHYNMWLAEDTALRVKRQFVSLYGEPLYTVGIGGSGGAIQQYLIAQNNPDVIDAAIPLYSYPDMVTQTIYVMDCEPLEYFFDVTDATNSSWSSWQGRSLVEGLSYSEDTTNHFKTVTGLASVFQGGLPNKGFMDGGSNECVNAWRGLTPLIHNPNFVHFKANFETQVAEQVHWTHWDDLKPYYGSDNRGFANSTWDNVGVQYGLEALREGKISVEEFLKLNAQVGGWKSAEQMLDERLWLLEGNLFPVDLSFWSHQNINLADMGSEQPAPRTAGSLAAMNGAYRSGHVFLGYLDIPVVDVRHYLDPVLDMHHASASFSARERFYKGQGHADNQIIWMAPEAYEPQNEAFAVIDRWMMNILLNPHMGVAGNKPYAAVDKCFDDEGQVIAAGADVWDGEWNGRSEGACMQSYPIAKTSREIAGGPLSGDIFKCQLQSVTDAIAKGEYGELNMWPYLERLETVFPEGVCDFSLADLGRPLDLLEPPALVVNDSEPAKDSKPALTTKAEDGEALTLSRLELDAPLGDDIAIPMSAPAPAAGHQDKGLTGR
jgi:hypothetical protein